MQFAAAAAEPYFADLLQELEHSRIVRSVEQNYFMRSVRMDHI